MSLFVPANEVYKTYFGTSPPSRATVAVPLPAGQRVKVEVLGYDDTPKEGSSSKLGGRQALHVQSLSYWAPANIGPYSQAVIVSSRPANCFLALISGRFTDTYSGSNPADSRFPHSPSFFNNNNLAIHPPSRLSGTARWQYHRRPSEQEQHWRRMDRMGGVLCGVVGTDT